MACNNRVGFCSQDCSFQFGLNYVTCCPPLGTSAEGAVPVWEWSASWEREKVDDRASRGSQSFCWEVNQLTFTNISKQVNGQMWHQLGKGVSPSHGKNESIEQEHDLLKARDVMIPWIGFPGRPEQMTTNQIETTEADSLTVLEARSQRAALPLKIFAFFQPLVVAPNPWPSLAYRCHAPFPTSVITWPSSLSVCLHTSFSFLYVCIQNSLFFIRTSVIGSTLRQNDCILTRSHLQRPCFPIRWHSQVPGVGTWTYLLGRHNSVYNIPF